MAFKQRRESVCTVPHQRFDLFPPAALASKQRRVSVCTMQQRSELLFPPAELVNRERRVSVCTTSPRLELLRPLAAPASQERQMSARKQHIELLCRPAALAIGQRRVSVCSPPRKPDGEFLRPPDASRRLSIDTSDISSHFACMATSIGSGSGIATALSSLLSTIAAHLGRTEGRDGAVLTTSAEALSASNFGKEKFLQLLDQLLQSLRSGLSSYRSSFPASQPEKLQDLQSTVQLLANLVQFRSEPEVSAVSIMRECSLACMATTYRLLRDTCDAESAAHGFLDNWHRMIQLMAAVVEEDGNAYAPVLNQFGSEFDIASFSAQSMWRHFKEELEPFLEQQRQREASCEYLNLLFKVKWFYNKYVHSDNCRVHYSAKFKPFVLHWLAENDKVASEFMVSAYARDKADGFPKSSDHALFTTSVVDVFTQLNQCLDVVKQIECPDQEVDCQFLVAFTGTVCKVLENYADTLVSDLAKYTDSRRTACLLLNNLHQLRVQLQRMFEAMGGQEVQHEPVKLALQQLQERLKRRLRLAAEEFAGWTRRSIELAANEAAQLLHAGSSRSHAAAGGGKAEADAEAELVLRPLIDRLDAELSLLATECDKPVLKCLLKNIWSVTVVAMETRLVLPADSLGKDSSQLRSLSPRQCAIVQSALDFALQFFHAGGSGLSRQQLERCQAFQQLGQALGLYTNTTDALITHFVHSQAEQESSGDTDCVGRVHVQVDLKRHPGTGEQRVIVKIVRATDLAAGNASMFRPFVEANLIGPRLANKRHRVSTKSRGWDQAEGAKFNENFAFEINPGEDVCDYELQLVCKDYCFARLDRPLGVSVLQLSRVLQLDGSYSCQCELSRTLKIDETGRIVLRILAQRAGDETAAEFVRLKTIVCGDEQQPQQQPQEQQQQQPQQQQQQQQQSQQ